MKQIVFKSRSKIQSPSSNLILCQCPECILHLPEHQPAALPPAQEEARGRWLSAREHSKHHQKQRARATTSLHLPVIEDDPVPRSPSPQDSVQDHASSLSNSPSRSTPSPSSPSSPSPSSSSSNPSRLPSPSAVERPLVEELMGMRQQLGHVHDILYDKVVYFEDPPSKESKSVRTSKMDTKSIDELCSLDVSAPSNSSIVGYQGLLSRTWEHAQTYISHPNVSVRHQAELNARAVEEEEGVFRGLLLREWRRQRTAAQESNFLNTCTFIRFRIQELARC
jgi:hypothetical protein